MKNKKLYTFLCFLTLCILIGIFFSRLFFPHVSFFVTPDFGLSDLLHGYYPLKYTLWKSLHEGRIEPWSAQIGGGYPIFADAQIGTFSIVNMIAYRLFPFIIAVNLVYIVTFIIAGWGMFLLSRSYKVSFPIALFSAVTVTFSGFMIAQISHISLLQTAAFLPLELYLAKRLMNKVDVKIVGLFAFIASQQILTGNPQMVVYAHTAITIFYFIETVVYNFGKPGLIKKLLKHFMIYGLVIVLSLAASAVLLIPNAELFSLSTRTKTVNMLNQFPYPISNLVTFLNPFFFGSPQNGTYPLFSSDWGNFWENNGYVGILPLVLFLLSPFFLKSKQVLSALLILFISILLVLGKYSPLYFIFQIPPWSFFRVASRFLIMTDVFFALLSALVLHKIFSMKKIPKQLQTKLVIALVIIQFINICYFFFAYHPVATEKQWFQTPKMVSYLKRDQSRFRIFTFDSYDKWNEIFLKEGWRHVEKYLPFRDNLIVHANLYYDIKKSNYDGSFRLRRAAVFNHLLDTLQITNDSNSTSFSTSSALLLGISNTKYILAHNDTVVKPFPMIFQAGQYKLYKNPLFLERVRFVDGFTVVKTVDEVQEKLNNHTFNPKTMALLEENVSQVYNTCRAVKCVRHIEWFRDEEQTIELKVSTDHPSLLILADTYYPGWNVYVDEKKAKMYPANIVNRAVAVPTGKHLIHFAYEPESFKWGSIISIIGYTLIIGLMAYPFLSRRRRTFFAKKKHSSDS